MCNNCISDKLRVCPFKHDFWVMAGSPAVAAFVTITAKATVQL